MAVNQDLTSMQEPCLSEELGDPLCGSAILWLRYVPYKSVGKSLISNYMISNYGISKWE